MPFAFRLQDYAPYQSAVGDATVVDVSRRTDPACIAKLWENLDQVLDNYDAPWIVHLWTKNPAGVLALGRETLQRAKALGATLAAQVTVTGLACTRWEPRVPQDALTQLPALIALLGGPEHVTWRYDPIIPTVHSLARFEALADKVGRLGIRRTVINFIAPPGRYKRVDARLNAALPGWEQGMPGFGLAWQEQVAHELVALAGQHGLSLACCAESSSLAALIPGLRPAACGEHAWFVTLSGRDPGRADYQGSRAGCGCARSFDVGYYGQWRRCHGCLYCYAG